MKNFLSGDRQLDIKKLKFTDTDTLIRTLAKHPYLWAFGVCMLFHILFLSDISVYVTTYSLAAELLFLQVIGAVILYKKFGRAEKGFVKFIAAEGAYAVGVFGLMFLYSSTAKKMLVTEAVFLCMALLCLSFLKKKLKDSSLKEQFTSLFIIAVSSTLKLSYSLFTSLTDRQHDLYGISMTSSREEYGHLGYITHLMTRHALPNGTDLRDSWQYYHPPLHHFISALWVSFHENILGLEHEHALTTIKTLSLFYSFCIIITCYKLLKHFKLHGKSLFVPLTIICFMPQFTYFSASVNNDVLSVVFIMGAVLNTLRWYDDRTLKNILKIALCIGSGMMTKMSAALVAPSVALLFLIVFIKNIRNEWKKLLGQFACFGAVCIPLGLWFGIRNYIKWSIPITYVQEMPIPPEESKCYVYGHTLAERLFDFSPFQYSFHNVFFQFDNSYKYIEYNPMIALFKSSLFNEYFSQSSRGLIFLFLCNVLFWLNVALALFSVFCKVKGLFAKNSTAFEKKLFLLAFHATLIVGFYKLAIDYPFSFSMNFRYISPIIPIGAVFIGMFMNSTRQNAAGETAVKRSEKLDKILWIAAVTYAALCAFLILDGCCPLKFI